MSTSDRSFRFIAPAVLAVASMLACAADVSAQAEIRVNQIGYYPDGPKIAAVITDAGAAFDVVEDAGGSVVFSGTLSTAVSWAPSGEVVRLADFSDLRTEGIFRLRLPGGTESHPFAIRVRVHEELARAALKGFYFQRASFRLREPWAGPWARLAGHADVSVRIHSSAASESRPVDSTISASRGWYDAGDYNKYVVNSGISTYTVLAGYEHYPEFMRELDVGIPESGGQLPDILAEALWNLDWMLSMQDPGDGGVYHKLTTANFSGYVMPHQATATRYVVEKSTAATLNFAAVMAQASRVFRAYEIERPGLSEQMEAAALSAWGWARANPARYYNQSAMNQSHSPAINTGEYGDTDVRDEFAWAAIELHVTTRADSFLTIVSDFVSGSGAAPIPSWQQVRSLGYYTLLHHRSELGPIVRTNDVQSRLLALANMLRQRQEASAMATSMLSGDFYWGSNSVAANQGMALMQAFRATRDSTYLHGAISVLDYILGRNGVGISFVTGHGSSTPLHPHHRPSIAGAHPEPVPGLLVGGPNPGRQDASGCNAYGAAGQYPSSLPARAYLDHHCSYASNEIAINWNAPLAYLAIAVEAAMSADGLPSHVNSDLPSRAPVPDARLVIKAVYPQPSRGSVAIDFDLIEPGDVFVELFDLVGRRVHRRILSCGMRGQNSIDLDPAGLPDAAYVLRISSGGSTASQLIVIAR